MSTCPPQTGSKRSLFSVVAHQTACWTGRPTAFILALATVIVWGVTGPLFGFSDTWQLVINTGTTIITFLMVFLIQNSQNRDTVAIHLKLDEVLRSIDEARNNFMDLEDLEEDELEILREEYRQLAEKARALRQDSLAEKKAPKRTSA